MDTKNSQLLSSRTPSIVAQLQSMLGDDRFVVDYVMFRTELAKAQSDAIDLLIQRSAPSTNGANGKASGPDLKLEASSLDFALLQNYYHAVCSAVALCGNASEDFIKLQQLIEEYPNILVDLVRWELSNNEEVPVETFAKLLGLESVDIEFFAALIAAPFAIYKAHPTGCFDANLHSEQTRETPDCPDCGSSPGLAVLRREDGKRILHCSLCGTQWLFYRARCPFCGNTKPDELGVLLPEENASRWVETCEHCKGYIKSVDERKLPEDANMLPFVEETATVHLDMIAEDRGYKRKLPYVSLV